MPAAFSVSRLTPPDVPLLRELNAVFGQAFGERETYLAEPPSDAYLAALLAKEHVIALVALAADKVHFDMNVAASPSAT